MKPKVLIVGPLLSLMSEAQRKEFAESFTLCEQPSADIVAAAAGGQHPVPESLIRTLSSLQIIANFGAGCDRIDLETARARGIPVTNTPGPVTEDVADTAIWLALSCIRRFGAAERHLRDGLWKKGRYPLTASFRDYTVGIAGLGRIGSAIAIRLVAMKVSVLYFDIGIDDIRFERCRDMEDLADKCNLLILSLPENEGTRGIVNKDILKRLGPDGILVNVGRGSAVDEGELIEALENGTIAAAGLDVYESEPNLPDRLLSVENAVLLPHVASATKSTREAMGQLVIDNLKSWFSDGIALTPV